MHVYKFATVWWLWRYPLQYKAPSLPAEGSTRRVFVLLHKNVCYKQNYESCDHTKNIQRSIARWKFSWFFWSHQGFLSAVVCGQSSNAAHMTCDIVLFRPIHSQERKRITRIINGPSYLQEHSLKLDFWSHFLLLLSTPFWCCCLCQMLKSFTWQIERHLAPQWKDKGQNIPPHFEMRLTSRIMWIMKLIVHQSLHQLNHLIIAVAVEQVVAVACHFALLTFSFQRGKGTDLWVRVVHALCQTICLLL